MQETWVQFLGWEDALEKEMVGGVWQAAVQGVEKDLDMTWQLNNSSTANTRVQWLGRMVRVCLVLEETAKLSSKVNVPFLFPPAMNESSYYSISLPHPC